MSMTGIFLMWIFTGIVLMLSRNCGMTKENHRRQAYWAKYEDK
jgi:hypothetical protein